jgi:hypothetical protein
LPSWSVGGAQFYLVFQLVKGAGKKEGRWY